MGHCPKMVKISPDRNLTCLKEQKLTSYLSVLKQIILSKTVRNQIYINSCKQYGSWSAGFSWKQCRSRSAGFWRNQLIRIHIVFNARFELKMINQNMKYRIVLTLYIVLIQGQANRNFWLVLNEMGPGRTSRAWYFHSPGWVTYLVSDFLKQDRKCEWSIL